MSFKQTTINSSFFPHRHSGAGQNSAQYQTEDADLASDSNAPIDGHSGLRAGGANGGDAPQVPTSAFAPAQARGNESKSKPNLFARKSSKNLAGAQELPPKVLENAEEGKIILVVFEENDPENPMNWSMTRKWITTGLLCAMCLFIGLATASFSSGIDAMTKELGVSTEIGQVGMLLFNGAFSIVPLVLGPLSEFVGRNPVYLGCYAMFVVWFIPLALGKNIGTILVSRFLSGAFGAAGTTIIPGTLADIWTTKQRGLPVALFSLVAVLGTVAAPLYCGFIVQNKGWRWIEWVQLIVNGAVLILELFLLRETRGAVLLARRAKKLRKETGDDRYRAPSELEAPSLKALLHASTTRAALLLVREPVVLFFSLWLAYAWALIFAFFSGIPLVFQGLHGWGVGVGGLAYIGPILGVFFAFGLNFHAKHLYDRAQTRNHGIAVPEARLYYAAVGGILSTIGMFIFAFTSYRHVHWIGPEIGLVPTIMGIYFIFDAVQNYLSDSYGEYASSAISAQGFVRNALAASFPLFSTQMFNNLTIPYAGLLLACLLAIAIPLPFILIKYGARIRAKSRYAAANTGAAGAGGADEGPVMGARKSGDLEKGARRRKPEASQQQQQQQQQPEQQQGDSVPTSGTQTRAASPTTSDNKEKEHFEHTH